MDKFFTEGTYKLSNYCLICFDGEYDKAYDLLQGQVLSDVGHCKEEKFELSALCDEKGFILADFYISLNKNKFVIAIDIELKNIFLTEMQKFLPFYNIKLVDLNKEVVAICGKANVNNTVSFKIDVVMDDVKNNESLINYQQWECNNLLAGNIHLDKGLSGKYRPHEVLYDKNRVSFTKGCFRGQEVIARVEYRSKKRIEVKLNAEPHPPKNKKIVSKIINVHDKYFFYYL